VSISSTTISEGSPENVGSIEDRSSVLVCFNDGNELEATTYNEGRPT